ncbi:TrmH family RNA methyltransferase [Collimonas pratensis]|uniref:SpoU rRNA Methylase family protein n=1 Tax=Collimonas pratensis TaxID=279113 RepID=A0A127Q7D8_9BURK|nr:RNA methyltransferase [Collimonas pratensis]AMP06000.1 spoU rRNA Methylase family protein [Collimonas pratensis]
MKSITSSANPLYKELKQLATSAQARRKAGRTLLDGIHLTESYLQHGGKPELCVASETALGNAEAAAVIRQCQAGAVQCVVLPDGQYQTLSQVEHGVGLLFVIEAPQAAAPAVLTQSAVLLDNLQDPGNLGSILRSAAAAGIKQIYCSTGSASAWSPKVLRAGMGAHFILDIFEGVDLAALMSATLVPVFATSSYATQSIYQADLRAPLAWLFGHEGQGVAEDLLQLAGQQVVIPHRGQMESLNVAAAAAVCFFEQLRQTS